MKNVGDTVEMHLISCICNTFAWLQIDSFVKVLQIRLMKCITNVFSALLNSLAQLRL